MATDVFINIPDNNGGGGGGGSPTGPAGGDLGGAYPNPIVVTVGGITAATIANAISNGTPNTFAGYDSSGNLISAPGWDVDANGQATADLAGTQPTTNFTQLQLFPSISSPLSGGYEGIIVGPVLTSTMAFTSMYNAETQFNSGYNNSGGIGIYQDQSNLNSGSITGNYDSFGSFPQIHGVVSNFSNYTANASIDSNSLTGLNAFSIFNQYTSGYANTGGTIGFADASDMGTGTSSSYYTSAQLSPAFAAGSTVGNVQGISISPNMVGTNTGSYTGIQVSGTSSAPVGGNATGISVQLNGVTDSQPQGVIGLSSDSRLNVNATTTLVPAQQFQIGTRIEHAYQVLPGSPVTGTDSLGLDLAGDLSAQDNIAVGPSGLGFISVGFVADMAVASGKTVDKITTFQPAVALPDFGYPTGGSVPEMNMIRLLPPFAQGGTLAITNLYGIHLDSTTLGPWASSATNTWGFFIDDSALGNYIAGNLAIGTTSTKVTNNSVALEIGGTTKAVVFTNVTTIQKLALTALPGMQVFDTTLNKMSYYNGTTWINF